MPSTTEMEWSGTTCKILRRTEHLEEPLNVQPAYIVPLRHGRCPDNYLLCLHDKYVSPGMITFELIQRDLRKNMQEQLKRGFSLKCTMH